MAPPPPVIDRHLALQRQILALPELGQFQRPIFAIEHVGFGDRGEASDRFGPGNPFDRRLGDVGGDACILCAGAQSEQAEPRHQDHAGQGIVHGGAARALFVAREIGPVVGGKFLHGFLRRRLEGVELGRRRRRHDQRLRLHADHMVGRDHAFAGIARKILAVDISEDGVARAEVEDRPPVRAFAAGIFQRAEAAQDGRHRDRRRRLFRQGRGREHLFAVFRQPRLGQRDEFDHALVGFARISPKVKMPCLSRIRPSTCGFFSNTAAAFLARPKPGMR